MGISHTHLDIESKALAPKMVLFVKDKLGVHWDTLVSASTLTAYALGS